MKSIAAAIFVWIGLVVAMAAPARAAVTFHTVALSGAQAPGAPVGVSFGFFDAPVLSASGHAAFFATLRGSGVTLTNHESIWSEASGSLAMVAREGNQAPGTPLGTNFSRLGNPIVDALGRTAYLADLQSGSGGVTFANDSGLWSEGSGTLALVAREGSQAPGAPAGAVFSIFRNRVLSGSGHTAFLAELRTNAGGVTSTNDSGIWSEGTGTLALAAREGSQAPDMPAGANFSDFSNPAINGLGRIAFSANLQNTGGGVTSANNAGIWSERSGALALVAREGSQAPGTPAGVNFGVFNSPVLSAAGAAFTAILQNTGGVTSDDNTGLWSEGSGALALVAREGSQAPDMPAGENFSSIDSPVLNDSGHIAFNASTSNSTGIWSNRSGTLALVAREGAQAPGMPAGTNFDSLGLPVLNASGRVAFFASVQLTSGFFTGIWAEDRLGQLTLVVREHDLLQVAPGDFRTIELLNIPKSLGVQNRRPLSFNDDFQIAFHAMLSNSSGDPTQQGVFTATLVTVPEPTSMLLIGAAILTAFCWRNRPAAPAPCAA